MTTHTHMIHPDALNHQRAANAYDAMAHQPESIDVQLSYIALRETIVSQWLQLIADGLDVNWHGGDHEYASSADMLADVWDRQRLFTRHSALAGDEFLPGHPMAEVIGWTGEPHALFSVPLMLNDIFRAVHDVRGHADSGSGFGPEGEMRAWLQHRSTMPRKALPALWNETRGQAAWTNDFDNHRSLPLSERPFAEQKAGIPPTWAV